MSAEKGISHDTYFRRQFSKIEFARSFFENYLPPEIRQRVNWKKLRLVSGDFVSKALRNRRSDIVYEIQINNRKGFFYVHLEHQRTVDKEMAYRMLVYTINLWEQYRAQYPGKPLPLILPMVVFQGPKQWNAALNLHDMLDVPDYFKPYCPQLTYSLMDLPSYTDEEIQGELFNKLALIVMKNIDSPKIAELLFDRFPQLILDLLNSKRGVEYVEDMLYYLFSSSPHIQEEKIIQEIESIQKTKTIKEYVMTLVEKWEKRGIEQGIVQGLEQGIEQGEIKVVSKLLNAKFQEDAIAWIEKLSELSPESLEEIAERIITRDTLPEIFEGHVN